MSRILSRARNFVNQTLMRRKLSDVIYLDEDINQVKHDNAKPTVEKETFTIYESESPRRNAITYFDLFKYSTKLEKYLIIFAIVLVLTSAVGLPYEIVIYGEFTTLLVDRTAATGTSTKCFFLEKFGGGKILINASEEDNRQALRDDSTSYIIATMVGAIYQFCLLALAIDVCNVCALKQISRINRKFFESILRQDMAWYDTNAGNDFTNRLTNDLDKLREGIGEKLIIFTFLIMTFVLCIIASFFYGWKLTLVVISCTPLIIVSTAVVSKLQASLTEKELKAYSSAGAVAEEVLRGIRTVFAFSGEQKEVNRYTSRLTAAEKCGKQKGLLTGLGNGTLWFIIYCSYALALWYGVKLILEDRGAETKEYTAAALVIILLGVLIGAQNMGYTFPYIEAFSAATAAGNTIFSVINKLPSIDPLEVKGHKLINAKGCVEFCNVYFSYPARNNFCILKGLSLTILPGQTTALVGSSGCGKSTCIQLIQRLYDPVYGCIKIDDIKIDELNVQGLRSIIGVVGQEPILFNTTILENIKFGNPSATNEEVEKAAKTAFCHKLITKLPQGYNTVVGENGTQLSGGQKQRIAIARAIVRDPRILLLDEATSALDTTSESKVQTALERAKVNRTTVIVSHRLSTIKNADNIVLIEKGEVAEQGTHEELMKNQGHYFDLVSSSKLNEEASEKLSKKSSKSESWCASISSAELNENKGILLKKTKQVETSWMNMLKLNGPEWIYILIGVFAALVFGASLPAFSILFGEFYGILSLPDSKEVSDRSAVFSYYFIALGIIAGTGSFFQNYMLNLAGVHLTSRLRKEVFTNILSQEISWFDKKENSIGSLCAILAGDCSKVEGATGSRLGIMTQVLSTVIAGMAIAMNSSWNLALVTLTTLPIMVGAMILELKFTASSSLEEKNAISRASTVASEAVANKRTVASLGIESIILERYSKEIDAAIEAYKKKVRFRGIIYSLGQCSVYFAYGLSLYYGGMLVANGNIMYKEVIKVTEALIFSAFILGQLVAYSPNISEAFKAAKTVLQLLSNKSSSSSLRQLDNIPNEISYENIYFQYPSRPEVSILSNLNLKISKNSTVALVGASGCGKSTCIQLLLRYYDPSLGCIKIDGRASTDFTRKSLCLKLGVVSQEPVLFDRTIAENIAYGDNLRDIPITEIMQAAMNANIHEFIVGLPQGYDTTIGAHGSHISGGQKQRIAIARALIRNPPILILDEATSALDVQSEKIVQETLQKVSCGRTCIIISHRLTAVKSADTICVLKNGTIVEKGSHVELMALNGIYSKLYKIQEVK